MRIAHVLSSLNFGGQERIALDLALGQERLGHQTVTFTLDHGTGPLAPEFAKHNLSVVAEPKRGDGFDTGLWKRLAERFRQHQIDVVHTHNPLPLYYAALPARWTGAGLVHTKHGINPTSAKRTWMRRGFGLLVERFVCVSESTAEVASQQRECRRRTLRTVLNGTELSRFAVDPQARRDVRAELGIPETSYVVGTVGRIYPEKAHPFLIESLADDLGSDFHLVIVGTGPDSDALAASVAARSFAEYVHLTGPRDDIPRIMAAFDCFVLPSLYEGLPLVLVEAMAVELPVVATAVGGVPKVVVEGETGFLIEVNDGVALRDRVRRLRADPALARKLGRAGRKIALEKYSAERMVREYLELYQEVA